MPAGRPRVAKSVSSTAVAYLRWSTDEQDLSPKAQRDAVTAWATYHGVPVVSWHEDAGVSGGAPLEQRPGLLAATEAMKGARYLIVAKRDRLARDVLTAALVERLAEKAGVEIVSADGVGNGSGPEAALMRAMIDAFAAYERLLIGSRTKAALKAKRDRGLKWNGGIPWGYKVGPFGGPDTGKLVPDLVEQGVLATIEHLRDAREARQGAVWVLPRLAAEWPTNPRTGAPWRLSTVRSLLYHRPAECQIPPGR